MDKINKLENELKNKCNQIQLLSSGGNGLNNVTEGSMITLELSDKYENMPTDFKQRVPKTHQKLQDLISLYFDKLNKTSL